MPNNRLQATPNSLRSSLAPGYEAITLAFGGYPTTIEYNLPDYGHPEMKELLLTDYRKKHYTCDVALSISSFEHDGLGRYGDPIKPEGDLRAMSEMKKVLKPNGILFLAVPVGMDKVVWNGHRV